MSMAFRLIVPLPIYEEMVAQALAEQPNECCGLLGGVVEICSEGSRVGRVVKRYPLVNEAKSPVEFFNGGKDLFQATRDMRECSLDTAMNWSEGVVNVIISLTTPPPTVRAWWLTEDDYREAEWQVQ